MLAKWVGKQLHDKSKLVSNGNSAESFGKKFASSFELKYGDLSIFNLGLDGSYDTQVEPKLAQGAAIVLVVRANESPRELGLEPLV